MKTKINWKDFEECTLDEFLKEKEKCLEMNVFDNETPEGTVYYRLKKRKVKKCSKCGSEFK